MGGRGGKGRTRVDANAPSWWPNAHQPSLDEPPEELREEPQPPTEQEPTDADRDQSGGLESGIRNAYQELAAKPQDWVRLSKLREKLGNPDKAEMDAILRAMSLTGRVHLAPDSNRKVLTDADHTAAYRIGSEDKHLIAIEPPDDDPSWR